MRSKNIQEFCTLQTSIAWQLRGFNRFVHDDTYVVFIDVVPSAEIRDAHARFFDLLKEIKWMQWAQFGTPDLHYHVTLATHGLTAENFESVWSFRNQQTEPVFKVCLDNLALIQIDDDRRSVYQVYPFKT